MDLKETGWESVDWIWLCVGTISGLLCSGQWTFGFHKMQGISWLSEEVWIFQLGLCAVPSGSKSVTHFSHYRRTQVVVQASQFDITVHSRVVMPYHIAETMQGVPKCLYLSMLQGPVLTSVIFLQMTCPLFPSMPYTLPLVFVTI